MERITSKPNRRRAAVFAAMLSLPACSSEAVSTPPTTEDLTGPTTQELSPMKFPLAPSDESFEASDLDTPRGRIQAVGGFLGCNGWVITFTDESIAAGEFTLKVYEDETLTQDIESNLNALLGDIVEADMLDVAAASSEYYYEHPEDCSQLTIADAEVYESIFSGQAEEQITA